MEKTRGDNDMYCPHYLSHTIRQGDNLYHLAQHYQTTLTMILSLNPNIDPYNLRVGSALNICPGENYVMQPNNSNETLCPNPARQFALMSSMRLAWEQHVYWTRMLLISIAERLGDQSYVTTRLLQNPDDIANIFAAYYPPEVAATIAQLLTEHLEIGAALITALRDGQTEEANSLNRQWYVNADKMASAFASINPYFNQESLSKMLYKHLDLTKQEVSMRLAGNYQADIEAFNQIEQQALSMADYFSAGIMQQFPQFF